MSISIIINGQQIDPEDSEALAAGGITFGGSIVAGDQIGHSGGTHEGDIVMGSTDDQLR